MTTYMQAKFCSGCQSFNREAAIAESELSIDARYTSLLLAAAYSNLIALTRI